MSVNFNILWFGIKLFDRFCPITWLRAPPPSHRRRIYTEEKAKVVATVRIDSFWIRPILQIVLVQFFLFFKSSWCIIASGALNKFFPSNCSDDLCLSFVLYPPRQVYLAMVAIILLAGLITGLKMYILEMYTDSEAGWVSCMGLNNNNKIDQQSALFFLIICTSWRCTPAQMRGESPAWGWIIRR